ncbi:MAG: cell division protein FtsZ [Oscillospiraceae bacterium]|jgi:cell division protein FtsZ|nr:cell division protein FtsZ [Oscillospiraceae bacterium]
MFTLDDIQKDSGNDIVRIRVFGIGGAGNHVVSRMVAENTQGITFVNINTDKHALAASAADIKLQIGEKLTKGQGAGSDPSLGRKSAEESRNNIIKLFDDTDIAFFTAGMGGGTGTGAISVISELARECGVLTVGVVTKPFKFEGARKLAVAEAGITELLKKVDTLIVIPNENLRLVSPQKVTLVNAFGIADGILRDAVTHIAQLLRSTGNINLDFADLRTILRGSGYAHMGIGAGSGHYMVDEAVAQAAENKLMESSIRDARRILLQVIGSPDITLDDVEALADKFREYANSDANIIFGFEIDDKLDDELRVVVIATDFGTGKPQMINRDSENDIIPAPEYRKPPVTVPDYRTPYNPPYNPPPANTSYDFDPIPAPYFPPEPDLYTDLAPDTSGGDDDWDAILKIFK